MQLTDATDLARQIAFIDTGLPYWEVLAAAMPEGAEVILLNPLQDGVLQIAAALEARDDLDAIHILSHGATGSLQLGTAVLDQSTLRLYEVALQTIGKALTDSGDLLLYGCNVAAGDAGQAFIAALAEITGADVAASVDLTGAPAVGGDWKLEATAPEMAAPEVEPITIEQYPASLDQAVPVALDGLLAYYPFDGNSNDASGNGKHGTAYGGATYTTGASGLAVTLDGLDDWIDLPDLGYLSSVTVSAFIKHDYSSIPTNGQGFRTIHVIDGWSARENFAIALGQSLTSDIEFYGGFHESATGGYVYPEVWAVPGHTAVSNDYYHVAITYENRTLKLYVEGQLAGTAATPDSTYYSANEATPNLRVGLDRDASYFFGAIDELRIYDHALSDAEILQLAGTGVEPSRTPVPVGLEFLVNTTVANSQHAPTIAALADGRFVVAWTDGSQSGGDTSGYAVRAQVFTADGTRSGSELLVNTTVANGQYAPTIAALADGRFVVAWTDNSGDTSSSAIRAQVFTADGTKTGSEFLINTTVTNHQMLPTIAALADGRFAVAWTDGSQSGGDTSSDAVRAQVFSADGTKAGAEFLVNTTVTSMQGDPTITALADGRFVVAWEDFSESGSDNSWGAVRAQVFSADGTKSGTEFLVNTTVASDQWSPTITALADGRFVVAWTDDSQSGGDTSENAIRAQVFAADGTKSGAELLVNTTVANGQFAPTVTALADGRFVVAWTCVGGDASVYAVRAQVFVADGTKLGAEFLVNTTTTNSQDDPTITALADGRFVVAWTDASQSGGDTAGAAIRAQVFDAGASHPPSLLPAEQLLGGKMWSAMADFANAAYFPNPTSDGWAPLTTSLLGTPSAGTLNASGVYSYLNAAALVLRCGDAAVISFKGTDPLLTTDGALDWINNLSSMLPQYVLLQPLIKAFDDYVADPSNGIDKVYVTGHSLGGALAQMYMMKHPSSSAVNYEAVTFAAPGFNEGLFLAAEPFGLSAALVGDFIAAYLNHDSRVLHFEMDGDVVPDLLAKIGDTVHLHPDTLAWGPLLRHDMTLYQAVVHFLDNELLKEADIPADPPLSTNVLVSVRQVGDAFVVGDGVDVLHDDDLVGEYEYILGGASNDDLSGRFENKMYGGAGDDVYWLDNRGDVVIEKLAAGGGTDTVHFGAKDIGAAYVLPANVEHLYLMPNTGPLLLDVALNGTGNDLGNRLVGNNAANVLRGLGGNDTLNGGNGWDELVGGTGNDTYVVSQAFDKVIETSALASEIDTVQAAVSWSLGPNVETLILLGTGKTTGEGNGLGNRITGNGAANLISGFGGSDTLLGNAGYDTLVGGLGNDTLAGGLGKDVFRFEYLANTSTNRDTINDFSVVDDTIQLENFVFSKLGAVGTLAAAAFWKSATAAVAHDATDRILYNTSTGALFYDPDGTGPATKVQFATLVGSPDGVTNADFVVT